MGIMACMGCSRLMRPTHNKNFMILASSIAKSRFSQSATYGADHRLKIIESAKRQNGTIWPSYHYHRFKIIFPHFPTNNTRLSWKMFVVPISDAFMMAIWSDFYKHHHQNGQWWHRTTRLHPRFMIVQDSYIRKHVLQISPDRKYCLMRHFTVWPPNSVKVRLVFRYVLAAPQSHDFN
jgi:hypothetical protein